MKIFGGKKTATAVLSVALAATLAAGLTLAYLNARTDAAVNHFTFVNGSDKDSMTGGLTETNYDPDQALDLVPGDMVAKNPQVWNTTGIDPASIAANPQDPSQWAEYDPAITAEVPEWAAAQVIYEGIGGDGTAFTLTPAQVADVLNVLSLGYADPSDPSGETVLPGIDSANWAIDSTATNPAANGVKYYYRTAISNGEATSPLFTAVTVKPDADNDALAAIAGFAPGGINIRVEGAVSQADNIADFGPVTEEGTAMNLLSALFADDLEN
ncbi:MAG: hypothetical protein FWC55_10605 [Firmicutes bacterium]|nr:hypothetical protein [Bacillota bacterium]